jgi:iron complex transport system ATP-binding protein
MTPTEQLDDVVATIQTRVPYLRCTSEAPPDAGWIGCAALIADPSLLRREVEATAAGRGTDDIAVAASLYAQAYAFRVSSIAVAAYALDLPGPTVAPDSTAVRIARHRPAELAVTDHRCARTRADDLATALFGTHLAPFVESVRATVTIGERLLWGNVAASIATVFRAVQSTGADGDPAVRARAVAFESAATPWTAGLGSWSAIELPSALGWYWNRTSCCLWYRTTGGSYCDDCSLLDRNELTATRRAELTESRT